MQCLLNRHCSRKHNTQVPGKCKAECIPGSGPIFDDQGFVLIVTLGIMAVLSILAWSFVFNTRVEIKTSSWRKQALGAYYMARAGLHRTAGILAAHGQEEANGPGSFWWPELRITDEESYLNINVATAEMLMQFDGITSVLAEEILIYRAKQVSQENSLEQDEATISGPITNVKELLHIHGMSKEILFGKSLGKTRLGNNITCYSSGKVNVNTARPMVLTSLGFSEDEVRAIELFRSRKENAESVDSFLTQMNVNTERLQKTIPMLTVKSTHFCMTGTAALSNKAPRLTISARCDLINDITFFSLWQTAYNGVSQ